MDDAAESATQAAGLVRLADRLQIEQDKIDKYASNAAGERHFLLELSITELHEGARQLLHKAATFAPSFE
jgi:hypothetical protein